MSITVAQPSTQRATTAARRPPAATRWLYLDAPLIAFVVVMVAAATITSHGTFLFFSYILPAYLAAAATIVLTLGIPLLELAAVLDKASRNRYLVGLVFLLFIEGLAQYFQGQAIFVAKVSQQFPVAAGIDLATFAQQPRGRLLPMLYLASLSGVVVYFGYAASARIRELRGARAAVVARDAAIVEWQRRAVDAEEEAADLAEQLVVAQQTAADAQAQVEAAAAGESATLADLRRQLVVAKDATRGLIAPTHAALVDYARGLVDRKVPLTQVAAQLGVHENTLRGWLKKES